uniref:Beta-galactosidase n=1 Tax=Araucaria cunninghamii TaxID=56994 RepID=A0A0D6R1L6_ARACU
MVSIGLLLTVLAIAVSNPLPIISARHHQQPKHQSGPKFWISDDMFWKDGKPFQIIGGDLHYFRVLPEYWEDRLLRAKALGLNVIQTYVPWNVHEPIPGEWNFDGVADFESFFKLAHKLGFLVMLRPGPYICGEWDLGGFPAWLLAHEPPLTLRSSDPAYLRLVTRWWTILFPKIVPLLYSNGGPIIMVQIENEYGSFGDDKNYLQYLVNLARTHFKDDVILYTTDGGAIGNLNNGSIGVSDIYAAVDFSTGEDPWPIFELQKKYNAPGKSPALSAEFYTGWLTHWGEKFAETDAAQVATELDKILSNNGSAVLYMAHGGTNFGFFSGANTGQTAADYEPDLTSYDYDAPIREDGDVDNPKFKALRDVIGRYSQNSLPDIPIARGKEAYGQVRLQKIASLFNTLEELSQPPQGIFSENPVTMESLQQISGFMLYKSKLPSHAALGSTLSIPLVHDRAQVFVAPESGNQHAIPIYVGTVERWSKSSLIIPNSASVPGSQLLILVENMGRVNYGRFLYDPKGLLSPVLLDGTPIYGWTIYPIPLGNISQVHKINTIRDETNLKFGRKLSIARRLQSGFESHQEEPTFYNGYFNINSPRDVKDTYISFHGWTKGVAFINGFNVGRFWPSRGPQCNLYVPAPLLHYGENELVILELEKPNMELEVNLVDSRDFTCGKQLSTMHFMKGKSKRT